MLALDASEWSDRIRFLGVVPGPDTSVDEVEVRAVADRVGWRFPQLRDRDLALTRRFGVQQTPTVLVLGRGAEVLYRGDGPPADWAALASAARP